MKPIYLLFAAATLFSIACNDKPKDSSASAAELLKDVPKENLNAASENFTITTPEGWTTERETMEGVKYYFLYAPEVAGHARTNMNVLSEDMRGASLETYLDQSMEMLPQAIPTAKVQEGGDIEIDGIKSHWYMYTMEPQAGHKAAAMAYVVPKDGVAYVITGVTQESDLPQHRATFDATAKTLHIKN